jgi:F-type H+-transporting ATPase subunit delta
VRASQRARADERVDVAEPASISSGIAQRYASAVFDLAREDGSLPSVESDIAALDAALGDSADLRALIASPIYSRDEQGAAIAAVAGRMGLSTTMRNVLGLMAQKRRLFTLPHLLAALRARLAEARGEVEAEVVSAQPLSPEQEARLRDTLSASQGKRVTLRARVDQGLVGGLVVKLGSKMIDTSIRSRLGRLQTSMREAR